MKLPSFKLKNSGQSLLLVVIVLFIVFFLVVSVSENISIDTVNTAQNQKYQQAFNAAESGLSAAREYIKLHPGTGATTGNGSITATDGSIITYNYTITPQSVLNQEIQKDQAVQVSVVGSTSTEIQFNDNTSVLLVNVTNPSNGNFMCIYYPQGLTIANTVLTNFSYSSSYCGSGPGLPASNYSGNGNYWTVNINTSGDEFLRATVLNTSGNSSDIIINPGTSTIQQYQVTPIGVSNGSRAGLISYVSVFGAPPHLFDYVLVNAGSGKSISF